MSKDYYYGKEVEDKTSQLKMIKVDEINWYTYYLDEETTEKFVKVYLDSHLQGGGPPRLSKFLISRLAKG